jgi:hypothetical protein
MTDKTTPLYVVCSPCRGVGKTLVSRLLAEFYVVNDRPVAAFDLADEGPQLTDYLPGITTVADIADTLGQMTFFDRLIANDVGARSSISVIECSRTSSPSCKRYAFLKRLGAALSNRSFFSSSIQIQSRLKPTVCSGTSSHKHLSYRCVIRSKQTRYPMVLRAQMQTSPYFA